MGERGRQESSQAAVFRMPRSPPRFSQCLSRFGMSSCDQASPQDSVLYTQPPWGILPVIHLSSSMNTEVKNVPSACSIAPNWRSKDGVLGAAASEVPIASPWETEGPVSPPRAHASTWGELSKARISESPDTPSQVSRNKNLSPSIFLSLSLLPLCSLCLKPPSLSSLSSLPLQPS